MESAGYSCGVRSGGYGVRGLIDMPPRTAYGVRMPTHTRSKTPRPHRIHLRLNDDEFALISADAAAAGLDRATYVRETVFKVGMAAYKGTHSLNSPEERDQIVGSS